MTYLKIDTYNIFDNSLPEKLHSVVSVSQPAVSRDRIGDGMYTFIKCVLSNYIIIDYNHSNYIFAALKLLFSG